MPTIHREHGLRFVIYVDDHPPPHVHVTGRGTAKIALLPEVRVVHDRDLSKADIGRALGVVRARQSEMIDEWNRCHG